MALLTGTIGLGLQVVGEGPLADAQAGGQAVIAGEPEVNAAIDTTVSRFAGRSREAAEIAEDSWQKVRARLERNGVGAVEQGEHGRGCAAEGAVAGDIVRERWCPDKRTPCRVRLRGGIAIGVAVANRGDGPPVVVSVLGVPDADARVGHRDIQEGKQAGVLLERVALSGADPLSDMIPMARWRLGAGAIGPELRALRLVRRAGGTDRR